MHSAVVLAVWDYARYQTELAISDHSFVKVKPSVVGMAALLNAMEGMDPILLTPKVQAKLTRTVEKYTSMDLDEVNRTQARISNLMLNLLSEDHKKAMEKALDKEEEEEWAKSCLSQPSSSGSPISVTRKSRMPQ